MNTGRDYDCLGDDILNIIENEPSLRSSVTELKDEYIKKTIQNKKLKQMLNQEDNKSSDDISADNISADNISAYEITKLEDDKSDNDLKD